jgi:hypothetical protein
VTVVDEIRRLAPLDATAALVALGFEPMRAARPVVLRLRLAPDAGDAPAPATAAQKRLLFARWLVEHGRLSDGAPAGGPDGFSRQASDGPHAPQDP